MANKTKKSGSGGSAPGTSTGASGIWGGRFDVGPADVMQEINASIDFDRRLFAQDIAASKAHAAMLAKTGIISQDDGDAMVKGLDTILGEIDLGKDLDT